MTEETRTFAERFPKTTEPATKGDVVRALIYVRSCTIHLAKMINSISVNTPENMHRMKEFIKEDQDLAELINELSGGEVIKGASNG